MADNNENQNGNGNGNGNGKDSWITWQRIVLADIDRNGKNHDKLEDDFNKFQIKMTEEIATLKTRAALWGALGALIASPILLVLAQFFLNHMVK